jgi:hypothetical protein
MRAIPRFAPSGALTLGSIVSSVIVGCALLVGAPTKAEAQPQGLQAEVLVLHGTDCAVPFVDPQIGEVPPLKHNCWHLLGQPRFLPLVQGSPSSTVLPNGRTFQVVYNGLSPDHRHKIGTWINKKDGPGFNSLAEITAEPGKRFHVGGFAHANGTLVLAIRIVPKSGP